MTAAVENGGGGPFLRDGTCSCAERANPAEFSRGTNGRLARGVRLGVSAERDGELKDFILRPHRHAMRPISKHRRT